MNDFENEWLLEYKPRNSFGLNAAEWVQHCKIGTLMLNACSAFDERQVTSSIEDTSSSNEG
jgi:hypothetical protein